MNIFISYAFFLYKLYINYKQPEKTTADFKFQKDRNIMANLWQHIIQNIENGIKYLSKFIKLIQLNRKFIFKKTCET